MNKGSFPRHAVLTVLHTRLWYPAPLNNSCIILLNLIFSCGNAYGYGRFAE
jgi:hypothetical protein